MSIYAKLLEVQKEIGAIKKDSTNPFFKSKYFDINSLLAEVKPVLNKHGLVLTQGLTHINGKLGLRTEIVDAETGELVTDICPIPESVITTTDKNGNTAVGVDAQKMGAAITYFRRYALTSLLALEAEDDDAEGTKTPLQKAKVNSVALSIYAADKPPFGKGSEDNED